MGKTWKDIKKFDIKRNKEGSRMQTQDVDMRTRVKPIEKKERKLTLREIMDKAEEDTQDFWSEEVELARHALTGE